MRRLNVFFIGLLLTIPVGFLNTKINVNAGDCTSSSCAPAVNAHSHVVIHVIKPIVNFSVSGTKVKVKLKADYVSSKKLSGKVKFYASGVINKKVSAKKGKASYSKLPKGTYKLKVTYYPSKSVLKKYKHVAIDFAVKTVKVS